MASSSSKPLQRNPTSKSQPQGSPALHDVPPNAWLLALEWRAFWEFGALLPAWPLLARAPKGDGHPVMVFPGLSTNDVSTVPLRYYLQSLNYQPWGLGTGF